ncbi:phage Gp19/Gp15/Gp42 family protein [uncultured Anaerococcus sp.]|uniref:phage Gp19/Gp15/Gp42 family protein n=1 Tax=uncultured Anaerococcus sp. TaxID=293428 RepID=UPI002889EB8B|nr:phage Gp19/Gp15/Gp42 family protein [uncultured Anaerococcus sp.]
MESYLSIDDLIRLWRPLKGEEIERAEALIPTVVDSLREEAKLVGKDLDEMAESVSYRSVLKSVIADVVARTLMTSTDTEPMTQFSESALGYSYSGSFLVPGGGLFIKNTEKARLGLRRQRYGVMNIYDEDKRY